MELLPGGSKRDDDAEVERLMGLVNDIIRFVNVQKYKHPHERCKAVAMALGRVMGSTANNRRALRSGIGELLELAREGAEMHMGQRERGEVEPPPVR
jgi:hypothetical protein